MGAVTRSNFDAIWEIIYGWDGSFQPLEVIVWWVRLICPSWMSPQLVGIISYLDLLRVSNLGLLYSLTPHLFRIPPPACGSRMISTY